MQIKGFNSHSPSYHNHLEDVKKKDAIDDLFHIGSQQDSPSTKLRLSPGLQRLHKEFTEEASGFLKEHPQLHQALDEVQLPKNEYTRYHDGADLTIRKLKAYFTWNQMENLQEKPSEIDPEHPFSKVQAHEKDKEIKDLFINFDQKVQKLHQERKHNSPNYYYLFFPETYKFN